MENPKDEPIDEGPEFIRISTVILFKVRGPIPFDVYIERALDKFTKIFQQDENLDQEQLKRYHTDHQVNYFYIHRDHKESYSLNVEKILQANLTGNQILNQQGMRSVLNEMVQITLEEVHEKTDLEQRDLKWAETLVNGCTQLLESDFDGLCKIMKLMSSQPYQMKHSFMCAIFSLLLSKKLGYTADRSLKAVGIGALLHDIGMTRVDPELHYKDNINAHEWKELKEHAQLGTKIIDTLRSVIKSEVRSIILQHHEQPNGMGYPNGLYGNEIFPLAKIVSIADVFSTMIVETPYRSRPINPLDALDLMTQDVGKFDKAFLEAFVELMRPQFGKLKNEDSIH